MVDSGEKTTALEQKPITSLCKAIRWYLLAVSTALLMFSIAAVFPVRVNVQTDIMERITDCGSSTSSVSCSAQAAKYYGFATSLQAFGNFLTSAQYGRAADRFGRKPFVLLAIVGLFFPIAFLLGTPSSLTPFYIAYAASGLTPQPLMMVYVLIADVSPAGTRLDNFGIFGGSFFLLMSVGSLLGSALVLAVGPQGVLEATLAIIALVVIVLAVVLPETRWLKKDEEPQPETPKRVVRAKSVARILIGGSEVDEVARWHRKFYWLFVLSTLPEAGLASVVIFYQKDQYGFTSAETSLGTAVACFSIFLWQSVGVKILPKCCPNQGRIFQFAIISNFFHFMPYILITAHWAPYLGGSMAGSAFLQPMVLRAMITDLTDADSLGRVNGIMYACTGVCQALGPGFCGGLYAFGSGLGLPQLPWLSVAFGLLPLSFVISAFTVLPESMPPSLLVTAAQKQPLLAH